MGIHVPTSEEVAHFIETGTAVKRSLSTRNIVSPYSRDVMVKIYENGNDGKCSAQRERKYSNLFRSHGVNVATIYNIIRIKTLRINEHTEDLVEKISQKPFVVVMQRIRGQVLSSLPKEVALQLSNAFETFLTKLETIPVRNTDFNWGLDEIILNDGKELYLTDFEDCERGPINGLSEDIRSLRMNYDDLLNGNR